MKGKTSQRNINNDNASSNSEKTIIYNTIFCFLIYSVMNFDIYTDMPKGMGWVSSLMQDQMVKCSNMTCHQFLTGRKTSRETLSHAILIIVHSTLSDAGVKSCI